MTSRIARWRAENRKQTSSSHFGDESSETIYHDKEDVVDGNDGKSSVRSTDDDDDDIDKALLPTASHFSNEIVSILPLPLCSFHCSIMRCRSVLYWPKYNSDWCIEPNQINAVSLDEVAFWKIIRIRQQIPPNFCPFSITICRLFNRSHNLVKFCF